MALKHLDKKFLDLVDRLSDDAIEELLLYIREKRQIEPFIFLNLSNLNKILLEDAEVLEKLAK